MLFSTLKSLHIIFVVTWFAGLFYLGRLFVYHALALEERPEGHEVLIKQYTLMEKRLWFAITWPSAIITLILGPWLSSYFLPFSAHKWLVIKYSLVAFLFVYHLLLGRFRKDFSLDRCQRKSSFFRYFNEIPTLFLFAIVFLVVFKNMLALGKALLALGLLMGTLIIAIKLYKKSRIKNTFK